MESKYRNVEPDAPDRCQAIHGTGQCRYGTLEDSLYCPMHIAGHGMAKIKAKAKHAYLLGKWQGTVNSFADDSEVKSLRGEIGIARMVLEQIVTRCKDGGELILYMGKITESIGRIEKLVSSCDRLESKLGLVLDKPKLMLLATQIVAIISEHVEDDDAINSIADALMAAIMDPTPAT